MTLRKGVIKHYGPEIKFQPKPYWRGFQRKLESMKCSHDDELHVKGAWYRCMDCDRWREGEIANS